MRVRTDDEVYRVDAVWLGPPKATFPWRARYVAWGVGILVFFLTLTVERYVGFGFGFFTVAWGLVITVVLTRFICSKIGHERPLGAVFTMWARELSSPRESTAGHGGAASATRIRVRSQRPRPRPVGQRRPKRSTQPSPAPQVRQSHKVRKVRKPPKAGRGGQPPRQVRRGAPRQAGPPPGYPQTGPHPQLPQPGPYPQYGPPGQSQWGMQPDGKPVKSGRPHAHRAQPPSGGKPPRRSKEVGGVRKPGRT